MKKYYTEIGIGNSSFISTEIETQLSERRISGIHIRGKFQEIYLRFWIGNRVFILSSKEGFVMRMKDKKKLKMLLGVLYTS